MTERPSTYRVNNVVYTSFPSCGDKLDGDTHAPYVVRKEEQLDLFPELLAECRNQRRSRAKTRPGKPPATLHRPTDDTQP